MVALSATTLVLTMMAVMTAEAGLITRRQIIAMSQEEDCPPNGTTVEKTGVEKKWFGHTLLLLAAMKKCTDLVRNLLALQANKFEKDPIYHALPLHWAAAAGADGVAALLLDDGDADRQRIARENKTMSIPLHKAIENYKPAVVPLLVANCTDRHLQAQLSALDHWRWTPLMLAIAQLNVPPAGATVSTERARLHSVHASLGFIAAEIAGRAGCPPNATFIAQMLRGQLQTDSGDFKEVKPVMRKAIANASKTTCTA